MCLYFYTTFEHIFERFQLKVYKKSNPVVSEVYGSLTFVDVGTPIRKNDSGSPVWDWLHEITNR